MTLPLLSTSDRAVELSVEAGSHGASVAEVSQLQSPGGQHGEVDVGARSLTEPTKIFLISNCLRKS